MLNLHKAVPKHDVLVKFLTKQKIITSRIGTQQLIQCRPYIYCRFQTVFSAQIIMLNFESQLQIYTKEKNSL